MNGIDIPLEITNIGVSMLVNLTELNLANNRLMALDGLETLQMLLILDVSSNLISSVIEVCKLEKNKALVHLKLAGNPITNKT